MPVAGPNGRGVGMPMTGSVVMVSGAGSAIGAAIVRELLARRVDRVYVDRDAGAADWCRVHTGPQPVPIRVHGSAQALAGALTDVSLLIHCAAARPGRAGEPAGTDRLPAWLHLQRLTQAFAPVLSRHGGGAVVTVLCDPQPDPVGGFPAVASPGRPGPGPESLLGDALLRRLAAQHTRVLSFRAQWAVAAGETAGRADHWLVGHLARRLLDELDRCQAPVGAVEPGALQGRAAADAAG